MTDAKTKKRSYNFLIDGPKKNEPKAGDDIRAALVAVKEKIAAQGRVVDDRLLQKAKELENLLGLPE